MLQKCALAQEIRLGSPDRFSSGEGGVWGRDYTISWGIVYHRLRTVNLYRILAYSSEARPSRAYPANMAGKSEDIDKALKFALCCIGKGRFHVESRAAGCDQMYLRW